MTKDDIVVLAMGNRNDLFGSPPENHALLDPYAVIVESGS